MRKSPVASPVADGGGCSWRRAVGHQALAVPTQCPGGELQQGDAVTLRVDDASLLSAALRLYLPPLAGLLAGPAALRMLLDDTGVASLAAALAGLVVVVSWRAAGRFACRRCWSSARGRHDCPAPRTRAHDLAAGALRARGCHLCEQFALEFSLDFPQAAPALRLCDVDGDPALALEYGLRVPVLSVAGRRSARVPTISDEVRRALGL
jgi:hypothetical protein